MELNFEGTNFYLEEIERDVIFEVNEETKKKTELNIPKETPTDQFTKWFLSDVTNLRFEQNKKREEQRKAELKQSSELDLSVVLDDEDKILLCPNMKKKKKKKKKKKEEEKKEEEKKEEEKKEEEEKNPKNFPNTRNSRNSPNNKRTTRNSRNSQNNNNTNKRTTRNSNNKNETNETKETNEAKETNETKIPKKNREKRKKPNDLQKEIPKKSNTGKKPRGETKPIRRIKENALKYGTKHVYILRNNKKIQIKQDFSWNNLGMKKRDVLVIEKSMIDMETKNNKENKDYARRCYRSAFRRQGFIILNAYQREFLEFEYVGKNETEKN
ncbi:hypothetical protein M0811_12545 [Anaeramoeba ignava]|uniref:Uncharacterized protein n=1 Tax=Anaeramoeba ignava TaxID=1746090 RepID=A0A9Q0L9F7_ANAIG|nr:hypothetical protein M0811_12545 [Anaeramoeba ignava]